LVIADGKFILGESVSKFEKAWADYLEVKSAVGVANGFDALVLSLKALGIGAGDLVAVPSHTFIATWLAVKAVGAQPLGIDCTRDGLMNIAALESSKYKFSATIPVHMHGQLVEMDRLMEWARYSKSLVVEDCAQAHGAETSGKKAGSWGHVSAFSFYPSKNLGALGDAGAVVTNDKNVAERISRMANYGNSRQDKYRIVETGINSRLDTLQASILLVNMKHLEHWNMARKQIAEIYQKTCQDLEIAFLKPENESVYHHFVMFSSNRELTRRKLSEKGVGTEIHYPEVAELAYSRIDQSYKVSNFPHNAFWISQHAISLPIFPWMTPSQIAQVCESLSDTVIVKSITATP
jgi:dTDP-4-amino-4,6-dideoxygalactose transaminase